MFFGFDSSAASIPIFAREHAEGDPENFTLDREWMPRVVMLAKNAYVWLDQLSRQYQRPIATLADIPDEELDKLAGWGFTGLWLIGLWERSRASRQIKQIMGNPEAVASAYSLYDYQIADKLGGEAACQNLRERAWRRGIRLASDMVPNHVGVDGRWVVQHPDWFVGLDYPPFPSYTFNGPDLSSDDRVGIFIEDHYYNHSDAAVVFKRLDHHTGSTKYIYHGNDGTSMPWNDTAQLNYLNPQVREGVIQTILHVARQFPIIRFDAAMTLAKRHYQRLWFPEPGTGGDIASRSEFGLTKEQFDAAMPQEFWREVVDRCAAEAPDTLLLAEAFWLMESYFVRTLGMHRVYNSAFMHILRDEDNAKYRMLMKNTLEFDPEILKRYVNFMNNPDERTAVDQFGKGDKYFGVCTLLSTMPGLPMFGHGQIEGFAEKYGMEYQRAYWDEQPDQYLVERHQREIFPLLHRRYLFANVDHFLLYDFYTPEGGVNEDVFAYSNGHGHERALVVYHNRFATARGWVRTSAAFMARTGHGDERHMVQRSLSEGLGLERRDDLFCIFRDHITNLEYIRNNRELVDQGLYIELEAYKYHVFLDFRVVQDNAWGEYRTLAGYLGGRGVPSIEEALRELMLQPIHRPLRELISAELFRRLLAVRVLPALIRDDEVDDLEELADLEGDLELIDAPDDDLRPDGGELEELDALDALDEAPAEGEPDLIEEISAKTTAALQAIKQFAGGAGDEAALTQEIIDELQAILHLPLLEQSADAEEEPDYSAAVAFLIEGTPDELSQWGTLFGWTFVHALGKLVAEPDATGQELAEQSRSLIDEWMLGRVLQQALQEFGLDAGTAAQRVVVIKQLTSHQCWFADMERASTYALVEGLLQDREVQQLLGFNRYQGVLWFSREAFERLVWWMLLLAVVEITADKRHTPREAITAIGACYAVVRELRAAAEGSGYQVEKLLDSLSSKPALT
jgi:glycosidase